MSRVEDHSLRTYPWDPDPEVPDTIFFFFFPFSFVSENNLVASYVYDAQHKARVFKWDFSPKLAHDPK